MKVAITGGTGFVGRNLARKLVELGHEVVIISRGVDQRDTSVRHGVRTSFRPVGTNSVLRLTSAFRGCDAVAHLGGINRELDAQTYAKVHVKGTENVVKAAQTAGVKKLLFLSFLRARPNCGSPYHESKFEAEEIIRNSGIDHTVFKAGVIYGSGDHMLDHITHALHTFPIFLLVGFKSLPVRPLAVEDLVDVMVKSILDGELKNATVPITGPEEMALGEAVRRISSVAGMKRLTFPVPVWVHYAMAWVFERIMTVPLAAKAQVRILSESLADPAGTFEPLPEHLRPQTPFSAAQILAGLPVPEKFGFKDCLHRSRRSFHR